MQSPLYWTVLKVYQMALMPNHEIVVFHDYF